MIYLHAYKIYIGWLDGGGGAWLNKAWKILFIIACANPTTIGATCWQQYPTLRLLMEMAISTQFQQESTSTLLPLLTEEEAR